MENSEQTKKQAICEQLALCKQMSEAMKQQAKEGKKDRYIEIAHSILSVETEDWSTEDKLQYMLEIVNTLEEMDFQIYEYYRALQDRLVIMLKQMSEGLHLSTLKDIAKWAVEKNFVTTEQIRGIFAEEQKKFDFEGLKESVELKVLFKTARSVTLEIGNGGRYKTLEDYEVYVNGAYVQKAETVVFTLYDLMPLETISVVVVNRENKICGKAVVTLEDEYVTLNVKDFGAKGDGETDDTKFIQTAILACPKQGRVLIPEGVYRITNLFLKSNVKIELGANAELKAFTDRSLFPILPAVIPCQKGEEDYNLGSWEGNPLPMFAGIITGIDVENVVIYGRGTLNGNASKEDWWLNPKQMRGAFRPRLFYTNRCKGITLQGITLKNSPAWTIHPYFSDDLGFYNITINNPSDSPNTDGLDPESCRRVEIAGVRFSLGDDCIAVKSGKIYMGKKFKQPTEDVRIHHCLMENGHGAVTLGSEMAGGVRNLVVEDCDFFDTDRGLRVKTRRGRGKDAILDNIIFRRIKMDQVMTPFVVNSFYFCDPDGKTEYVQSRELYPVDERTPEIKTLIFEKIDAVNCHVAGAYFEGLPEKKIEKIVMSDISISYADQPKCDVPAMSNGVAACSKKGIFAKNVKEMVLKNVNITGQEGEKIVLESVDSVEN